VSTPNERVTELFEDAQVLYGDALEMLAMDRLRNAAEKAWGATKRATDAIVLARTGQEPQSAGQARRALLRLSSDGPAFETFQGQYSTRSLLLHINCFYDGNCEPEAEMTALVQDTDSYIRDARSLAAAQ
jgi:hypothetical protein